MIVERTAVAFAYFWFISFVCATVISILRKSYL